MSTHVASSSPSTLRGALVVGQLERELDLVDDRAHLAGVRRADDHEHLGDRDDVADVEDDDVVALLVGGRVRGDPGSAVGVGAGGSETGATGSSGGRPRRHLPAV